MNFLVMQGMNDFTTNLFVFLIGVGIIFLGMAVIVLILQLIGYIFDKKKTNIKVIKENKVEVTPQVDSSSQLDAKTKAAIIGAIYMFYLNEGSNCEFIVKKIKKI